MQISPLVALSLTLALWLHCTVAAFGASISARLRMRGLPSYGLSMVDPIANQFRMAEAGISAGMRQAASSYLSSSSSSSRTRGQAAAARASRSNQRVRATTDDGELFYFDANNMPSYLVPPWVNAGLRNGPLAMPLPEQEDIGQKPGPMYIGVPPLPILWFDRQLPADSQPISGQFARYPSEIQPAGNAVIYRGDDNDDSDYGEEAAAPSS